MNHSQTVTIHNESDVIIARMKVRELARVMGLGLVDQARISLATSSLAYALGLGTHRGQIIIDCLHSAERIGVRVVCAEEDGAPNSQAPRTFGGARWMVDEMMVETLPSQGLRVTLIKWLSRGGTCGTDTPRQDDPGS